MNFKKSYKTLIGAFPRPLDTNFDTIVKCMELPHISGEQKGRET